MEYDYEVKVTGSDSVGVQVFCDDGRSLGSEVFNFPFESMERKCKKAHDWAKRHIEICKQQEVKSKFKAERK